MIQIRFTIDLQSGFFKVEVEESSHPCIIFTTSGDLSDLPKLHDYVHLFILQDDLLNKSTSASPANTNKRFTQLVVPQSLADAILYQIHDSILSGHPVLDRSLSQARRSYL